MESPSYWPTSTSSASPASSSSTLVDDAVLSPEITGLLDTKISPAVIDYLVDRVSAAVEYGLGRPSGSSSAKRTVHQRRPFAEFVAKILRRAEVTMSVVLGTLVYVDRARPHLRIAIEEWAHHRVFLGAVILASKYLNDSSLKNAHWALCTGLFGKRDVARIEREFLEVLDFELAVRTRDLNREAADMCAAAAVLVPVAAPTPVKVHVLEKRREPRDADVEERVYSGRKARRRTAMELYPAPSAPLSPPDIVSPASSCSSASSSGSSSGASSPDSSMSASSSSSSDEGSASPRTPPLPLHLRFPAPPAKHQLHLHQGQQIVRPPFPAHAISTFATSPPLPAPSTLAPPYPLSRSASPYTHAHKRSGGGLFGLSMGMHPVERSASALALYPACMSAVPGAAPQMQMLLSGGV